MGHLCVSFVLPSDGWRGWMSRRMVRFGVPNLELPIAGVLPSPMGLAAASPLAWR